MKRSERASAVFREGFNCAQAVLSTVAPDFGLDAGTAARAATAFGGGMARTGNVCGAVTGALAAIGLARGNESPEDKETKEETYVLALEFVKRFTANHGSIVCRELLGCDIATPEGHRRAKELGLFDSVCSKLVEDSVDVLEELLSK